MLTTAIASIARHDLTAAVRVAHGDATQFRSVAHLRRGRRSTTSMISYSLSMIPDWQDVLDHAVSQLKPGGQLHIVDFGDQERLPRIASSVLLRWLTLFDVTPRRDLQDVLTTLAERHQRQSRFQAPVPRLCAIAVLTLESVGRMPRDRRPIHGETACAQVTHATLAASVAP